MSLFSETERRISEATRPLRIRAANMIRRAVIQLINDSPKLQTLQLEVMGALDGEGDDPEIQDEIENFAHYGFTSSPPKGSEAILLRLGGEPNVQAVIATAYREDRPKLASAGDVTLWDIHGHRLELREAEVVIVSNGDTIELGDGATKGVAREGDPITSDSAFDDWIGQVQAAINVIAPGAVTPITSMNGTITSGSSLVKAVD